MLQSGRVFGDRANVVAAKGASDAARVIIGCVPRHECIDPVNVGLNCGLVAAIDLQGRAPAERERVVWV